jgi:hypothetical protein
LFFLGSGKSAVKHILGPHLLSLHLFPMVELALVVVSQVTTPVARNRRCPQETECFGDRTHEHVDD